MMRDEVFVNLDRGDPRLPFVRDSSFTANTHDHLIVVHAIDEVP